MRKLWKIVIGLLIFLLYFAGTANCQYNNHLILKKKGKNIKHYIKGDPIMLQLNKLKTPIEAYILAIGEDFIVIKEDPIPLKDITGIVKVSGLHLRTAGAMLNIAGPGLILIDGFNSLLRKFRPVFGTNILIAGASIFASGLILPLFQSKVYDMKKGYYLRIVPADPETYHNIKQTKYSPSL